MIYLAKLITIFLKMKRIFSLNFEAKAYLLEKEVFKLDIKCVAIRAIFSIKSILPQFSKNVLEITLKIDFSSDLNIAIKFSLDSDSSIRLMLLCASIKFNKWQSINFKIDKYYSVNANISKVYS